MYVQIVVHVLMFVQQAQFIQLNKLDINNKKGVSEMKLLFLFYIPEGLVFIA